MVNNYRLGHTECDVILKIGARSGRMAALFKSSGADSEEGAEWSADKSYVALALQLHATKQIGGRFDQNTVFWVGPDAVRKLIPLR